MTRARQRAAPAQPLAVAAEPRRRRPRPSASESSCSTDCDRGQRARRTGPTARASAGSRPAEIRMSALRISPVRGIDVGRADGVDRAVGRGPAHGGIAGVGRAPGAVVGRVEHPDRVAEAGVLERAVPLEDAGPHEGPPLDRDGAVDVVGDRLDRLAQGRARILLLEPPAVHVADEEALRGVAREVLDGGDEVADPVVGQARAHRRRPGARAASSGSPIGIER